jgi:putative sporulation protein YtaF
MYRKELSIVAQVFSLILLALAVSLDSCTVGFTYGLRKVKIPFKSIFIIAFCSGAALFISALLGNLISSALSPELAETIGGAILIGIGIWAVLQLLRSNQSSDEEQQEKMLVKFEIKSIGLVIQILKKPMSADFDHSGTITGIEAIMLGMALSLDAFGAGIGAAMLGFSPISLAAAAAIMSSIFVYGGMKAGILLSGYNWVQKLSFLPGLLLIIVGIFKL